MARRHLKRYKELANKRGSQDPLEYLFKRYNQHRIHGNHEAAEKMATMLLPFGHGKIAPVEVDTGETAQSFVFVLD